VRVNRSREEFPKGDLGREDGSTIRHVFKAVCPRARVPVPVLVPDGEANKKSGLNAKHSADTIAMMASKDADTALHEYALVRFSNCFLSNFV
jgi:hypothetical protein